MDNQSNSHGEGERMQTQSPAPEQKIALVKPIQESINDAKELVPEAGKRTSPWKKVVLAVLAIGIFGGLAYFANNGLFTGNIFNGDIKNAEIEDFFPSEIDDFTKVKIAKTELDQDVLVSTWENITKDYLDGKIAFSKSKLVELWEGKDLEILAAKWNGGKDNLVVTKLEYNLLKKLIAQESSNKTFYASVLSSNGKSLIAQRTQVAEPRISSEERASEEVEEVAEPRSGSEERASEEVEEVAEPRISSEERASEEVEEVAEPRSGSEERASEEVEQVKQVKELVTESKQEIICSPQKNFCIVGDYLLLGNSIELAAKIFETKKNTIKENRTYNAMSSKLKTKNSGLINGKKSIYLISTKEIQKYNIESKQEKGTEKNEEQETKLPKKAFEDGTAKIIASSPQQEGGILKYKEGGYKEGDEKAKKGVIVLQVITPNYTGNSKVFVSTQICKSAEANTCHTINSREAIPFNYNKYESGQTMLVATDKSDLYEGITALAIPLKDGEGLNKVADVYLRLEFKDSATNELAYTDAKHFIAEEESAFADQAGEEAQTYVDQVDELIEQIKSASAESIEQIEEMQSQALTIGQELAGKYSSGESQEITELYGAASVKASEEKNKISSALDKANELSNSKELDTLKIGVVQAKYQAQIAEDPETADQKVEEAKQYVDLTQTKLDEINAQISLAQAALTEMQKIFDDTEKEEMIKKATAGIPSSSTPATTSSTPKKKAPSYLIDEWDPTDDTIENATLISFKEGLASNEFALHGIHQFSPPFDEVIDWFKIDLKKDVKYTFTTNEPDKIKIKLAEPGENAACTAVSQDIDTSENVVVYKATKDETLCFKTYPAGTSNIPYSVKYKFDNSQVQAVAASSSAGEESSSSPKEPAISGGGGESVSSTSSSGGSGTSTDAVTSSSAGGGESAPTSSSSGGSSQTAGTKVKKKTIASQATLTVTTDGGTPASQIILAGAEGVELARFKFVAENADLNVKDLTLGYAAGNGEALDSTTKSTEGYITKNVVPFKKDQLTKVSIYDANDMTTPLSQGMVVNGVIEFNNLSLTIPKDDNTTIVVTGDVSEEATTGDIISVGVKSVDKVLNVETGEKISNVKTSTNTGCESGTAHVNSGLTPEVTIYGDVSKCSSLGEGAVLHVREGKYGEEYMQIIQKKNNNSWIVIRGGYGFENTVGAYNASLKNTNDITSVMIAAGHPMLIKHSAPEFTLLPLSNELSNSNDVVVSKFKVNAGEDDEIKLARLIFNVSGEIAGKKIGYDGDNELETNEAFIDNPSIVNGFATDETDGIATWNANNKKPIINISGVKLYNLLTNKEVDAEIYYGNTDNKDKGSYLVVDVDEKIDSIGTTYELRANISGLQSVSDHFTVRINQITTDIKTGTKEDLLSDKIEEAKKPIIKNNIVWSDLSENGEGDWTNGFLIKNLSEVVQSFFYSAS